MHGLEPSHCVPSGEDIRLQAVGGYREPRMINFTSATHPTALHDQQIVAMNHGFVGAMPQYLSDLIAARPFDLMQLDG